MKRLAVVACVLALGLFAAIAIAVQFLNPRALAASLAASVKADTGRELSFGEVGVTLLPRPALVLSNVRLGNAAWGTRPWLAELARVSADLDALALLTGRLRINHIALSEASVLLETDRDGNGNWSMGGAAAGIPAWLKALEVDEITLQALAFTYRNGSTGKATSAQLDSVRIGAPSPSRPLRLSLSVRASFAGSSVEAEGTIGNLAVLVANAPYPVDLEGEVGAAHVSVHGIIDDLHQLGGFRLALQAQAPELTRLAALFGATVPPLGAFRGAAQLTGSATAPVFSGIDVEAGTPERIGLTARGELRGSVAAGGGYEWQSSGVDLVVQGSQFSDLAPWLGKSLPALGQYRIAARVAGSAAAPGLSAIDAAIGGRKAPEIKLRGAIADLRAATGIDMKVEASAADWWRIDEAAEAPRLPPFRASARLRDARAGYRVDDLEMKIADSSVSASLQVATVGPRLRVTGKAASPLIDLAHLAPASGSAPAPAAPSRAPRASDFWKLADVDLDLKIGRLVFPDGRQLQSGSGRLALADGRLKANALQVTLGGAKVRLDGSVAEPQQVAGLDLSVALQGGELAELFKFFGRSIAPVGPYQGRAQVQGSLDGLRLTAIDATAGRLVQRLHASGQIEDAMRMQGVQLALRANVSDSTAAGRLFGADLPHLPAWRATARFAGTQEGYVFDDLRLALGRTSVQGRVVFAPGEPRPRLSANLSGPLVDLSELPFAKSKPGARSPLLAADVEADVRFDRVVLPDRRALGPVSGSARLAAGTLELKQFSVAVDGASATLDGRIEDPLTPAALDLMVDVKLTRGAGLAAFTGLHLQDLPPLTASARLSDVAKGYALAGLKLDCAAAAITGDVTVTHGAKRFKLSAKASSPLLDVSAFMRSAAARKATKPVPAGARAIPHLPLPLDVLRVIDADLDLRFDKVELGDADPLGPLLLRAVIADGHLTLEQLQLAIKAGQTLSASGTVDAAQSAWALRIEGTGIDLGEMLVRLGRTGSVTGGSTDLALQVQGHGKSLAAILGSLDGSARVKVGPHRLHNFTVNPETSLVLRVFGLANPAQNTDPDTDIKCLVARVPIRNGIITSERNVAAETAKYNAVMSGTVNLRSELIDLAVAPVVTSSRGLGVGEVSVIIRLRGTFAAPTVDVNPVGVAVRSAASIGAALLTLGGSLIADALLSKVMADPNPCATALAQ